MEQLLPTEEILGRPVNPSLYSVEDFKRKRTEGSGFLTKVLEQPKLLIKGEVDDIGESGQNTSA